MRLVAHTVVLALVCTIYGCGAQSDGPSTHNAISKDATTEEIKIGGIYAYYRTDEGKYGLRKILAVDDIGVHVRFYNEEFDDLPTDVSSDDLTFINDHVFAGTRERYLEDRLDLITVEGVSESELEGYRLWLVKNKAMREAMRGN